MTRGQGQACRELGGCVIQITYSNFGGQRYMPSGTRPCMRCNNNVRVEVNE